MKRLIFIVPLAFIACSKPGLKTLTEAEKREITVNVSRMLNKYFEDINKNGLKAEFAYLDSTAEFFWVPPGYTEAIRYDSVRIAIESNAAKFDSIHNTWTTLHIQALSQDIASYTGNIRSVMIDTIGKKMESNLVETGIVVRRNGGWKLLSGQTTLIQ